MASPIESPLRTSPPEMRTKTKAALMNRKIRIPKSCYPCYKRKVKCDRKSPCSLCVKRGYAHLCTFTHPQPPQSTGTTTANTTATATMKGRGSSQTANTSRENYMAKKSCCHSQSIEEQSSEINVVQQKLVVSESGNVLIDTQEWQNIQDRLAVLSKSMYSLRSHLETALSPGKKSSSPNLSLGETNSTSGTSPTTPRTIDDDKADGVRIQNILGGSPVHCGSDSTMAFLLDKRHQQSVFQEDSILSQLALDNQSATYPFLDLWSSNITSYSNESVCASLPDDAVCRRLLRSYYDVRLTLYPVIADFDQFQKAVYTLLDNRALQGICPNDAMALAAPFGFNISFIGILFAVLASGCQVSDFPKSERISMCQLYVSCAYQCLRNGNFLSRPNMEAIQTLLIIGDVLSYNMNPGVAYVTFGLAQRIALTLGLHAESSIFKDPGANRRQELWWLMAWQDSHFGLSYDRPVETLSPSPPIPRPADSKPGNRGYFETMCSVISLILQLLREEILEGNKIGNHTIPAYQTELDKILADASPHLRSEDYCFTLRDHVERLTLKQRSSYLVSEICRRSLKRTPSGDGDDDGDESMMMPHLCQDCIDSLISTIEAYIEMHQIIPLGSRSWIHIHSAISAAFLLSVDEGAQSQPAVWKILEKLEKVFSNLTHAANNDSQHRNYNHNSHSDQLSHSPESPREWTSFSNKSVNQAPPLPAMGDFFSNNLLSFGQTFMLSDSPLFSDPLMLGGGGCGGGGGRNSNSNMMSMAAADTDSGVEFLTRTLSSLKKINASFGRQKANAARNGTGITEKKKFGACCSSNRNREMKMSGGGKCHSVESV